ncbi:MAG: hypothetical protein NVSMB65_20760 [Chloroflexota bacterium]
MFALKAAGHRAGDTPAQPEAPVAWTSADEQDARAVQRCREGDLAEFSTLVTRHQEHLMTTAYHLLRDREEAADAVQETFLRAYRALDRYDGTGRVGAWLGRIGVNVCLSTLRARRSRPVAAAEEYDRGKLDGSYARLEQNMVLREALGTLPPQDRAILLLRHVEQLTSSEIGEALDLPAATVRTRLARALKVVREALPELADLLDPEDEPIMLRALGAAGREYA